MKHILRAFVIAILLPLGVAAQTYVLAPNPRFTGFDSSGNPVASGRLCTYSAGTTTPLTSYSDSSGTANANPIILDSAGRATIYLTSAAYRFILRSSAASSTDCANPGGTIIWDQDNIVSPTAVTISGTTDTVAKFNAAGSNITNSSITDTGSLITLGNPAVGTTSFRVPLVIGNTSAAGTLIMRSTSGVGTTDAIIFQVGNNGGTEGGRFVNSGRLGLGVTSPSTQLHAATDDATTGAVTDILQVNHSSSGTPAANFGTGILLTGESNTTDARNMARIQAIWSTATDATRTSSLEFQTVNSAAALASAGRFTGALNLELEGRITEYNNAAPTDGQLLIGNTGGSRFDAATLTAPAAGLTITNGGGTITFALANDLSAVEGLAGTGLAARTAANTWTTRSIVGASANQVIVSNGDGVAGNPSLSTPQDIATTSAPTFGGLTLSGAANPTLRVTDSTTPATLLLQSQDTQAVIGTETNHTLVLVTNNTNAISINNSQDVQIVDVGPHAMGGTVDSATQFDISGTFSGSANNAGLRLRSTLNGVANSTLFGFRLDPTLVEAGSGTHSELTALRIDPAFTSGAASTTLIAGIDIASLTAPSVTTTAHGLRVALPTGATTNYTITADLPDNLAEDGAVCINSDNAFSDETDGVCDASSLRVKTDIRDIPYGISEVMRLHPVLFRYKPEFKPDFQIARAGFIAEEMNQVIPEVVTYDSYDAQGQVNGQPDGIDYGKLTAVTVKAIQELVIRVQELERKVN